MAENEACKSTSCMDAEEVSEAKEAEAKKEAE